MDLASLKQALAHPQVAGVVIGFRVYESFEATGADGIVPMHQPGEGLIGGHCVVLNGYDDATALISGDNSYGDGWADHGRFHFRYGAESLFTEACTALAVLPA
jgi:C1A family cysteine protease